MTRKALLLCLSCCFPLSVLAQAGPSYRCVNGDLVRRVEILYETGVAVPCEVHYYKDTEAPGEREVLWVARNQSGFCEASTQELIEQLRGWGWECADSAEAAEVPAAAEPAAAPDAATADEEVVGDDTDALSAGEPGL